MSGPAPKLETQLAIPQSASSDQGVLAASVNPLHAEGKDQVVTAGGDGNLRLWNFKGDLLDELKGHEGSVCSVRFAPNGADCASGSSDASVRLWPLKDRVGA